MRKLDIIANEKFNGNIKDTIYYLLYDAGPDAFSPYVDELSREEAKYVMDLYENEMVKKFGSKEKYEQELKKEISLSSLNLSEEEVRNAEKNPYKAKILKTLLKILIMEGGVIALSLAGNTIGVDPNTIGMVGTIINGLYSMTIATNILDYVKYRNLKKSIDNNYSNEELNLDSRGRKM